MNFEIHKHVESKDRLELLLNHLAVLSHMLALVEKHPLLSSIIQAVKVLPYPSLSSLVEFTLFPSLSYLLMPSDNFPSCYCG